jgi:hypothetical protein
MKRTRSTMRNRVRCVNERVDVWRQLLGTALAVCARDNQSGSTDGVTPWGASCVPGMARPKSLTGSRTLFVIGCIEVLDAHRPWRRPQSYAGGATICEFDTGPLERPLDRIAHGAMNGSFVFESMDDCRVNAGRNRNSSLVPIEQAARGPALRWYHGDILTMGGSATLANPQAAPMMTPITTTIILSAIYA